ncbi:MAG: threonine--tRNA ligase [Desulfarculus sp.]|nr:threonine--tRNA ligase [Desulfarculus sp.]
MYQHPTMDPQTQERLSTIRHSFSHLLAAAVQQMRPEAKLGIGPAIDDGFYYDFLVDQPFSLADLKEIEKRMRKLAGRKLAFSQSSMGMAEAKALLAGQGEALKVELVEDLASQGETEVSFYQLGDFSDLCKGPHVAGTQELPLKAFKLDRVAGAYWRGDEKRPMLSRIYGLAFLTPEDLAAHIEQREEAERRDHRKLGKEMDLFVISPDVGKGLPMFTDKGTTIRRALERFIVDEELKRGYLHVQTPILGRKHLYEISGHWEHYQDSMYPPINVDGEDYVLRPMTCPHHFMLYAARPRSYRELPVRYAEISPMYRKERSGELTGLIRVMGFHLADAHIFCKPEDVKPVFREVVDLIGFVMETLGLAERCWYRLSLRDDHKEKYIDAPESWARAEKDMREICEELKLDAQVEPGHAAFYGPKLDVQMATVGGREETLFTNQIDIALAQRFHLEYIAEDGSRRMPWVVHRSSIGCLERTIAFLVEHYAGALPLWMMPVQVKVLPITDEQAPYAAQVKAQLEALGLRVELDDRKETLNRKVREAKMQKIPYLCVVGSREALEGTVTATNRDTDRKSTLPLDQFAAAVLKEHAARSRVLAAAGAA